MQIGIDQLGNIESFYMGFSEPEEVESGEPLTVDELLAIQKEVEELHKSDNL